MARDGAHALPKMKLLASEFLMLATSLVYPRAPSCPSRMALITRMGQAGFGSVERSTAADVVSAMVTA